MKNKKNVIALLWVALVIVIIYTFIAFRVTRPEIQFLTKWTFTLDEKTLPSTESELVSVDGNKRKGSAIPFKIPYNCNDSEEDTPCFFNK